MRNCFRFSRKVPRSISKPPWQPQQLLKVRKVQLRNFQPSHLSRINRATAAKFDVNWNMVLTTTAAAPSSPRAYGSSRLGKPGIEPPKKRVFDGSSSRF